MRSVGSVSRLLEIEQRKIHELIGRSQRLLPPNSVNFATRGDPNGRDLPRWPEFVGNSSELMYIGDTIHPGPFPFPAGFGFYDSFYGSKRRLPF